MRTSHSTTMERFNSNMMSHANGAKLDEQQLMMQQLLAAQQRPPASLFAAFPQPSSAPQAPYATLANPEVNLFSQFVRLFPQLTDGGQAPSAPSGTIVTAATTSAPARTAGAASVVDNSKDGSQENTGRGRGGRAATETKGSATYATRHQAAEQRRRARINERLDVLSAFSILCITIGFFACCWLLQVGAGRWPHNSACLPTCTARSSLSRSAACAWPQVCRVTAGNMRLVAAAPRVATAAWNTAE